LQVGDVVHKRIYLTHSLSDCWGIIIKVINKKKERKGQKTEPDCLVHWCWKDGKRREDYQRGEFFKNLITLNDWQEVKDV
jgi:hypothetical protein